jgi:hypothetical protein
VRNRIEAVIDERSLDAALHISGISATDLLTNPANKCPKLDFPQGFQLRCLHGLHRIQAAREFLFPPDRWWTVDLYTTGKSIAFTILEVKYTSKQQISMRT